MYHGGDEELNIRPYRRCNFFFQAEDGIRDLVRSRGLGDVYKRQIQVRYKDFDAGSIGPLLLDGARYLEKIIQIPFSPVSYTHLTLPTSDLV